MSDPVRVTREPYYNVGDEVWVRARISNVVTPKGEALPCVQIKGVAGEVYPVPSDVRRADRIEALETRNRALEEAIRNHKTATAFNVAPIDAYAPWDIELWEALDA